MDWQLENSWKKLLHNEWHQAYFQDLTKFVHEAYQKTTCYPALSQVFAAFNACPVHKVKVVIIGQDPYHGAGQANGLCFSVADGTVLPPSLINIYKELAADLNLEIPHCGNLSSWAKQGVLLLNDCLTVAARKPGSHQGKGWEQFTDRVIQILATENENLVFMLWGNFAKQKGKNINRQQHLVLESGHPSPMSANRGLWFGNKHFSQANAFLTSKGIPTIDWQIIDKPDAGLLFS